MGKKFEYAIHHVTALSQTEMDRNGESGWELIHVFYNKMTSKWQLLWKREIDYTNANEEGRFDKFKDSKLFEKSKGVDLMTNSWIDKIWNKIKSWF